MQLARSILELRFEKAPALFSYKKKILDALNINVADKFSITENVDVQVKEQFAHITVQANRLYITIERTTPKKATNFLTTIFAQINNLLDLDVVNQVGYRCMYIEEAGKDQSLDELIQVYKENLYKDISLVNDAVDVGLSLTFKQGGYHINFNLGPMSEDQFKQQLEFNDLDLKSMHYLDLDFIKYDVKVSNDFITKYVSDVHKYHLDFVKKTQEAVVYE